MQDLLASALVHPHCIPYLCTGFLSHHTAWLLRTVTHVMGKKWWPALWRNWMPNPHGMRVLATGMASTCTIRCMYIPMLPAQDSPAQEHDILDTSDDITTQLFRKPSSHQSMSPQPGSASAETKLVIHGRAGTSNLSECTECKAHQVVPST